MNRELQRRLAKVEGIHLLEQPTRILADRPMTKAQGAEALANWRALVTSGEASVSGETLCLIGPELSEDEWCAAFATTH